MKKFVASISLLLFLILNLTGCGAVGDKSASLSIIYGATALLSLLLLIGCCWLVRKKRAWFLLLFSSVLVVNVGYTVLSISTCLEMALQANRVAYLGSVFLPLSMLMIILNVTNTKFPKWLTGTLFGIAVVIFLIAASPGVLDIYYKDVSFQVVNGVSTLVKVYGPLHPLYLFYLVGYFAAMVTVIIRAWVTKKVDTISHAIILAIAVFVNIGVWFIEQLTCIDFEMLSISYIISELFLLSVHHVMNENQRLRGIVKQVEMVQSYTPQDKTAPNSMLVNPLETESVDPAQLEMFIDGLSKLTPTEHAIYDAYTARVTTKEIMANLNIKENTLKYHNRNLYRKLGVSSRKELLEIYKQVEAVKGKMNEE